MSRSHVPSAPAACSPLRPEKTEQVRVSPAYKSSSSFTSVPGPHKYMQGW
ncbi:unnamed protein product [Blumeria hordei]|uniref:Uncharacterized protein n=1 Tax=Blumeria hordei TaxID=2867405 RepID=A0A383V222_BLUHO|nr:unnamed protein product [Blumeria hordei]